jgi:hypothetical protein
LASEPEKRHRWFAKQQRHRADLEKRIGMDPEKDPRMKEREKEEGRACGSDQ